MAGAFRRIGFTFGVALTLGIVGLFSILSIQYPSRMAFRGLSLLLVMPLGLLVPRAMVVLTSIFRKEKTS